MIRMNMHACLGYSVLTLNLGDKPISPEEIATLELPRGLDMTQGVVLNGRAPIWLYTAMVHLLHPTSWVAVNDPRVGAVVVMTHNPRVELGSVFHLPFMQEGEVAI